MNAAVAKRYAEALTELAIECAPDADWTTSLDMLVELFMADDCRNLFSRPNVPSAVKLETLHSLDGDIPKPVFNLLCLLVERRITDLLPAIRDHFKNLSEARAGVVRAKITSAVPTDKDVDAAISASIASITAAKKVELDKVVDSRLVGGMTLQIGDKLFDGSLRRRLGELKEILSVVA